MFSFVDLFAGIGGFRLPLEELGGLCIGFSEIDKQAIKTYKKNFYKESTIKSLELGSICNLNKIPYKDNIDLIVGGVPCQAWSIAGKQQGFGDNRGMLWHDTFRVIEQNQPKVFIFENVKGLQDPRNRENLDFILNSFINLGYKVSFELLNSFKFGLPQDRDRIFIVGFRSDLSSCFEKFNFPQPLNQKQKLYEILEHMKFDSLLNQSNKDFKDFFIFSDIRKGETTIHSWELQETTEREKQICLIILRNRRKKQFGNADGNPIPFPVLKSLILSLEERELHELIKKKILRYIDGKGYEFVNSKCSSGINNIYRIYTLNAKKFPTLTATGSKDLIALESVFGETSEEYKYNFINRIIKPSRYRHLTVREIARLQGFPDWFEFHENVNTAKKQFGNSVPIPVVYYLVKSIISTNVFQS